MSKENLVIIDDRYMRALLITCGKSAVKRFFNKFPDAPYHKVLEMACFLVANGITDFGSNDNKIRS